MPHGAVKWPTSRPPILAGVGVAHTGRPQRSSRSLKLVSRSYSAPYLAARKVRHTVPVVPSQFCRELGLPMQRSSRSLKLVPRSYSAPNMAAQKVRDTVPVTPSPTA